MRQLDLVIPVVDPQVPKSEAPRLGRMSEQIMARLLESPATNAELAALFPPGAAWRTRLSDCRKWIESNGSMKTISATSLGGGLCRYAITSLIKAALSDTIQAPSRNISGLNRHTRHPS